MLTTQDALCAYRTYARAEGKSEKTIRWIVSSVGYFAAFLGSDQQEIDRITANDLRRFISAMREKAKFSNHPFNKSLPQKLSIQSIETYCRGIRAFFGFLDHEGFLRPSPLAGVKMPKVPIKVVAILSIKEMKLLLAQPDTKTAAGFRDWAFMITFYDTTARLSELSTTKTADIDFEQNMFKVMGKGGRERMVPFGQRVAKARMKYKMQFRPESNSEYFWLCQDGHPLPGWRISRLVWDYGKKAGLKRCYPHLLRHSSATEYLRNGGDVFSLQRKLG